MPQCVKKNSTVYWHGKINVSTAFSPNDIDGIPYVKILENGLILKPGCVPTCFRVRGFIKPSFSMRNPDDRSHQMNAVIVSAWQSHKENYFIIQLDDSTISQLNKTQCMYMVSGLHDVTLDCIVTICDRSDTLSLKVFNIRSAGKFEILNKFIW